QALFDRTREIVGAQIFMRDFGGQENLTAWHAGGAHAFADAALGAVFPGRVDVAIAELQRGGDDLAAIAQGGGAEAERGYLGAVRGESGDGGRSHGREREVGAHSTTRFLTVNRPRGLTCHVNNKKPRLGRRGSVCFDVGEPRALGKSITPGC